MKGLGVLLFLFLMTSFYFSCQNAEEYYQVKGQVSEDSLRNYTKTLSSDAFMGRMPFTEGETKTVEYLVEKMKSFGLAPGNGDSYIQPVPLVDIYGKPDPVVTVKAKKGTFQWSLGNDFAVNSEQESEEVQITNSEFVFCGYGIVAPEYGWNDFSGLDLKGKTAVVLVNDPGLYSGDTTFFKGESMTYYGRWTYKYEEAARQGATGIMIVHDTEMAGYPWTVVRNGWSGSQQGLQSKDKGSSKCKAQGWISTEAATQLFNRSGQDYAVLREAAARPGFKPVPLDATWSMTIRNTLTYNESKNVIARIPGKSENKENLIYTAHWDHFGIAAPVDGDSIYNGAIDNATGVAALMEIARTFQSVGFTPERSILFLFVTAEEQGLLGSAYYATHPIYPPSSTVANLNLDALEALGPMKDVTMIGYGHSTFDEILANAAKKQDRYVVPDQEPEKGYFFRSDHFNFAKVGIPALYAKGAFEHRDKGRDFAKQEADKYTSMHYHQPSDEYSEDMDFGGIVEDVQLYYNIGWRLATGEETPTWKTTSEFSR